MIDFQYKKSYGVYDLAEIIHILRSPGGCPWDIEQTHESIRRNFIEETYEAVEAIDEGDPSHLCEELGDVLTQIVFHARIEEEAGNFNLDGVADAVCKKLIYRHPHVFSGTTVSGTDEVLKNWDDLKRAEKKQTSTSAAMSSVARSLPALWRAEKVQEKAARSGFDWDDISGALTALRSEVDELIQAIELGEGIADELGDVLFSAVNAARFANVDPEEALTSSTDKFIRRFEYVEQEASKMGKPLADMTLKELDAIYERGKRLNNGQTRFKDYNTGGNHQ